MSMLSSRASMGQDTEPNTTEFAVHVETMKLSGSKAKLFETGSAAV